MFRKLFNALALLSTLLLLGVLALWARSRHGTDMVLLRAAPSYAGGPGLKWVGVDNADGLVLSCLVKFVPREPRGMAVRWRDDVRTDAAAASVELHGLPVPARRFTATAWPYGRELTERERREYDLVADAGYRTMPWVNRQSGPPVYLLSRGSAWAPLQKLRVWPAAPGQHLIDEHRLPGAYRLHLPSDGLTIWYTVTESQDGQVVIVVQYIKADT